MVGDTEFNSITHEYKGRWEARDKLGALPERQYLGQMPQKITLRGYSIIESRQHLLSFNQLKNQFGGGDTATLSREGEPLDFFIGGDGGVSGDYLGTWVIDSFTENKSILDGHANPKKIEFTLTISQYG